MRKYNAETYLRSEHLLKDGRFISAKVTISEIIEGCPVKRGDKDASVIGLAFNGSDKVLGLNTTNFNLLCWEIGSGKPEDWIGKSVQLVVRLIRNKKLVEPGIRVWPAKPHPNSRVREQMGQEITAEWYGKDEVK